MAHPKDDEIYHEGTVVRIIKTNEFAMIKRRTYRYEGPGGFMHYEGIIEDRGDSLWCLIHDALEPETFPQSSLERL